MNGLICMGCGEPVDLNSNALAWDSVRLCPDCYKEWVESLKDEQNIIQITGARKSDPD